MVYSGGGGPLHRLPGDATTGRHVLPGHALKLIREEAVRGALEIHSAVHIQSGRVAMDPLDSWLPITREELEALIARQLQDCSPGHRAIFESLRVPLRAMPLHRLRTIESVWVVAHLPDGLLYYEDVEEGFEVGAPGEDGVLPDRGCSQLALTHVLHRLAI
jgi:hypothetical protein